MPVEEKETYYTEDDYYTLKRFLESKEKVKAMFQNEKRKEALKEFISNKNKIKDDMTKLSEDDSYAKALGLSI